MKVSKELWEQSIRLYWLGSSLIGKAVGRVQYELSTHKKLKYFVVGLGIVSMVLVIWSLFTNIFQATVHAHGGFRDYNGDGKIRVSLSAGHSESTAGKRINGYTNSPYAKGDCVHEWTLNDAVCDEIQAQLEARGVEVIRVDDVTGVTDISLAERVRRIQEFNPDMAISIHHNSAGSVNWCNATGIETYFSPLKPESEKLARDIAQRLSESVGLHNRGAISTDQWQLYMPRQLASRGINSVLVEGGMMDGVNDIPIIASQDGVHKYAKAVSDSVLNWLECGL